MHAQGSAFPHAHSQTPHFGASPFGLPGGGGLPPGLLALQGVAAAAQQAFLKDEKGSNELANDTSLKMHLCLDHLERAAAAAAASAAAAAAAAASSHKVTHR
jgi:hypothetical protein